MQSHLDTEHLSLTLGHKFSKLQSYILKLDETHNAIKPTIGFIYKKKLGVLDTASI
jgi:hypothetical protein